MEIKEMRQARDAVAALNTYAKMVKTEALDPQRGASLSDALEILVGILVVLDHVHNMDYANPVWWDCVIPEYTAEGRLTHELRRRLRTVGLLPRAYFATDKKGAGHWVVRGVTYGDEPKVQRNRQHIMDQIADQHGITPTNQVARSAAF